jgi:hypothetical protein
MSVFSSILLSRVKLALTSPLDFKDWTKTTRAALEELPIPTRDRRSTLFEHIPQWPLLVIVTTHLTSSSRNRLLFSGLALYAIAGHIGTFLSASTAS